jgi:hypothetical protein
LAFLLVGLIHPLHGLVQRFLRFTSLAEAMVGHSQEEPAIGDRQSALEKPPEETGRGSEGLDQPF